jgi:NitT/TauT family transport system substrate-binding protein
MRSQTTPRRRRRVTTAVTGLAVLAFVAAACGGDDDDDASPATTAADASETTAAGATDTTEAGGADTTGGSDTTEAGSDDTTASGTVAPLDCETTTDIKLQLQWVAQAQFAGYYAAQDLGYYEDFCLDVEIIENPPDVTPQQQLADGAVDFALAWVPKALATREAGADIVNIAQIFQRSGTLGVSFKDADITSIADYAGKNVGNWGFGNEYEIFAGLQQEGLDPTTDVSLVSQQFDMLGLLSGDIDVAEAMTYNEYAQVLEAENPATGELYQPEDLNVVSYEEEGVGMLQDAIWADGEKLANDPEYKETATHFVAASLLGWAYCRDNPEECRDIVLEAGTQLGASHQLWQMNEVNKLIWPAEDGIGFIDQAAWDRTVEIAQNTPNLEGKTVLTAAPTDGAFTNEIVEAAHELIGAVDLQGADFEPIEVTLEPGGS